MHTWYPDICNQTPTYVKIKLKIFKAHVSHKTALHMSEIHPEDTLLFSQHPSMLFMLSRKTVLALLEFLPRSDMMRISVHLLNELRAPP